MIQRGSVLSAQQHDPFKVWHVSPVAAYREHVALRKRHILEGRHTIDDRERVVDVGRR